MRGLGRILEAAGGGSIVYKGYDDCCVSKAGKMGIVHSMAAACGLDAGVYVGKAATRHGIVCLCAARGRQIDLRTDLAGSARLNVWNVSCDGDASSNTLQGLAVAARRE